MKKKIIILGANGMLGSMLLDFFSKDPFYEIQATVLTKKDIASKYPQVKWKIFDAQSNLAEIQSTIKGNAWILNAIGLIRQLIKDNDSEIVRRAIVINSVFPHLLVKAAQKTGSRIIQIATDCVYSGAKGKYLEDEPHDGFDVYSKTKSLGEVFSPNIYHLRSSIIGPEKLHISLLGWFLSQPTGAEINGFTNNYWNGVTTLHFAKICDGLIKKGIKINHLQHLVPKNSVSKHQLLQCFAKELGRQDIKIKPFKKDQKINLTLATKNQDLNKRLWRAAGYRQIPTIYEMIKELAKYQFKGQNQ